MADEGITWCDCAGRKVSVDDCNGCDPQDEASWEDREDTPLYPDGKLVCMPLDELRDEYDRQSDRQGRLGDAERIDDRAVEETEMRCRLVEAEIKRRKPEGGSNNG